MPADVNLSYSIGTVSVAANGTVVTGVGPLWSQSPNVRQWDVISINGAPAVPIVSNPTDDLHLSIPAWKGGDLANVSYVIYQISPLRYAGGQTLADIDDMLAKINTDGWYIYVNPAFADPTAQGLVANEGQFALKYTTGQLWIMSGAVWILQGIYASFIFDVGNPTYNPATTYPIRQLVSFQGGVWYSLQAGNIGHQPDTSPTFWLAFLKGGDTVYIAMDDSDRPATGETVLKYIVPEPMTIYAGMVKWFANADVGATLAAVYSITKNNVQFGTLTFAAGGQGGSQNGVFVCAANETLAGGDVLRWIAPNPRDATLSGIGITGVGYR